MIQDVIWDHYWDYTAAPALSEDNNPKGIQLRRTHGYRKPLGATVVSRPSRWGNPYRVGVDGVHGRAAQPVFLGLREDKKASEVMREKAI